MRMPHPLMLLQQPDTVTPHGRQHSAQQTAAAAESAIDMAGPAVWGAVISTL